jgi:hypothetical protein
LGHQLRDHPSFPAPKQTLKIPVVIVGGGIAGLSAAWQEGIQGFRSPRNERPGWRQFPLGRERNHGLPVGRTLHSGARLQSHLRSRIIRRAWRAEEWGMGRRYLCFAPQERLFLYGRWQEGIEPAIGLNQKDRDQFRRLEEQIHQFCATGKFTVPMERGLSDSTADLDRISFANWLHDQGMDSRMLNWYMNYGCRDDYGATTDQTSAWAGIQYFASREPEEKAR